MPKFRRNTLSPYRITKLETIIVQMAILQVIVPNTSNTRAKNKLTVITFVHDYGSSKLCSSEMMV
jgi:hypothetical protein